MGLRAARRPSVSTATPRRDRLDEGPDRLHGKSQIFGRIASHERSTAHPIETISARARGVGTATCFSCGGSGPHRRRIPRLTIVMNGINYCCMSIDVSMMLDALADPTRQRVIQLLRGGPRRAGELAKASGTSAPTMSRHLRVLLRAGIVGDDRPSDDARARVFWLRPEAIGAVRAWLDQLQVAGDEQLAAFKKHVERRDAT